MFSFVQRLKDASGGGYTFLGQSQSGGVLNVRSSRMILLAIVAILMVSFYALPQTYVSVSQTDSQSTSQDSESSIGSIPLKETPLYDEAPPPYPLSIPAPSLAQPDLSPSSTHSPVFSAIPSALSPSSSSNTAPITTLITYVYSESPENRANLEFFIRHGLHARADFVFIFNGNASSSKLLPPQDNIKIVERNNSCYDLGAHAEVLTKDDLWKKYQKFILMNASVRGPFIPHWAEACWSERFLNKVTDTVKLVGTTLNCWPVPHVQSMVWATDTKGLSLLLSPPPNGPAHTWMSEIVPGETAGFAADETKYASDPIDHGLNKCFTNRLSAVEAEIGASGIIIGAGFKVDVMLERFQIDEDYIGKCRSLGSLDVQGPGAYDGIDYSLFETIFMKTNRGLNPRVLELYSAWSDRANFSSYDYC